MRFTFNGEEWTITFHRKIHGKAVAKHLKRKGETWCIIHTKNFDKIVSGRAECSLKDQFSKETGRELALSRALDVVGKDEFRGKARAAYENRKPPKRDKSNDCTCRACRAYEDHKARVENSMERLRLGNDSH